jgi:MFS family permease
MPRVSSRGGVRIDVRNACVALFGGTQVTLAGDAVRTSYVDVEIQPARGDGSVVVARRHVGLDLPFFGWAIRPLVRISLRRLATYVPTAITAQLAGEPVPEAPGPPAALPLGAFDAQQAAQLSSTAACAAVVGFASALFGQLADPVSQTFDVSDARLGAALALTRIGALVALVVAGFADRQGRRKAILIGLLLSTSASAVSAIAPTFLVFTGAQLVQRAAVIATGTVAGIAAIEEAPERARAFAAAMLALAGGFGFSFAVIAVPVSDIAPWAWRLAFGLSAATVLLVPRIARNLQESTRYTRVAATKVERGRVSEVFDRRYGRRFAILAAAIFMLNIFSAPSSQLTNKYLDDVRHFSGADIALWRAVTTGVPGIVGLLLAGPLAEVRGRRRVMSIGLLLGILTQIVVYVTGGVALWVGSTLSALAGAAGGVALGTVEAEMFPTEVRGTSNALLIVAGVAGSAIGLLVAGALSDPIGLGNALALCGIGAVLAAVFLLPRLPESAQRLLDDVSPTEVAPTEVAPTDVAPTDGE